MISETAQLSSKGLSNIFFVSMTDEDDTLEEKTDNFADPADLKENLDKDESLWDEKLEEDDLNKDDDNLEEF
ncbi:MAG: hypothetical protein KY053_01645 [Candidatus Liptonbacteria bacterium]|nr:hypothetical protein [Candidatus Liptonbacteria bacterium]